MPEPGESIQGALNGIVADLRRLIDRGQLTDPEAKEVDSVIQRLRLIVYSRERAGSAAHRRWLKSVKEQRDAGVVTDRTYDVEELKKLASGG